MVRHNRIPSSTPRQHIGQKRAASERSAGSLLFGLLFENFNKTKFDKIFSQKYLKNFFLDFLFFLFFSTHSYRLFIGLRKLKAEAFNHHKKRNSKFFYFSLFPFLLKKLLFLL